LKPMVRAISAVLGILGVLWGIFYVVGGAPRLNIAMSVMQFLTVGASLFLPLTFLLFRATDKTPKDKLPWYDVLASVLSFAIPFYLFFNYRESQLGGWAVFAPRPALVLGIIMCVLLVEGARRTGGRFFAICVLVLAAAPLYVNFLPGIFRGTGFGTDRLISTLFVSSNGMFGQVMSVFILTFLLFIFYGVVLQTAGAGRFFTNVALAVLGEARGGAAKVAVIASALFGTITGSATANVMVSGSFTIPMMKKAGVPSHYAAAIEAAASEGGILSPPVMGAVAFIMANFLGIPYWQVALAATVPTVLFYWCLFSQVHYYAVNHGLKGVPRDQVPPLRKTLLEGWHIIAASIILVWTLFIARMSAGESALWSTVALIVLTAVNRSTRPNARTLFKLAEDSAHIFGQIVPILLSVGLIIGGLSLSGLDMSVVQWLGNTSQSVAMALLVLAVAGFVLGTGMPGSAVYILLAILLAPALEQMGLNRMAVHMTILYWGILADFTPPTAVSPIVAAGLAGASPMKTTLQTMRFGAVIYVAPIFFIFHPVILFQDFQITPFILVILPAFLGFWLLARGFEGYGSPTTRSKIAKRVACLLAAPLILSLVWYLVIAGAALAAGVLLADRVLQRPQLLSRSSADNGQPRAGKRLETDAQPPARQID